MPRPNPLTPEVRAAFLAELRRGTLVVAAAAVVGVAVSTLYWRRRRDPGFDDEWTAAAEASFGWEYRPGPDGRGRLARALRRRPFAGRRRETYLAELERTCNSAEAARAAIVDSSTVFRQLRRDPLFARRHEAALERGYERLESLCVEERAEARRRRLAPIVPAPDARPPRDFERQIHLLRLYRRPPPRLRGRWRDRRRGPSFEETLATLTRRLRHLRPEDGCPGGP